MATEFICSIRASGNGGDYTTLTAWEAANQVDLTAATTLVFSHGGITGTIGDGASVTGVTSGATGTVVHCTPTQILLSGITGTFQSGEQVQVDASNYVILSDAGDSAISVAECYKDDWGYGRVGTLQEGGLFNYGWETSPQNYIHIRVPIADRHNGTPKSGFRFENISWNSTPIYAVGYVHITGLEVSSTNVVGYGGIYAHGVYRAEGVLVEAGPSTPGVAMSIGSNGRAINCISIGNDKGFTSAWLSSNVSVENCTAIVNSIGFTGYDAGHLLTVKNCVSVGAATSYQYIDTANSTNNAASDASVNTPPGANPLTVDVTDKDFARPDRNVYAPSRTSILAGAGADLSAEFTTDIQGHSRNGRRFVTGWDIGAFNAPKEIVHTLKASGGDYTSLTAWEAAEQRDLVAADEIDTIECYNDWPTGLDTAYTSVNGWVTAANTYIIMRVAPGNKHDGKNYTTGFFITHGHSAGLSIYQEYTQIIDFAGEVLGSYNSPGLYAISIYNSLGNIKCINFLAESINGYAMGGILQAIYDSSKPWSETVNRPQFINCIAIGKTGGLDVGIYSDIQADIYNCTAVNCGDCGIKSKNTTSRTFIAKNCVAYNNNTNYSNVAGADSTNNAASDASINTPPGANPLTTDVTSSDFTDPANEDYSLSPTSILKGAGADLSSEFTTDIVGNIRTAPWDIGAFAFVGPNFNPHIRFNKSNIDQFYSGFQKLEGL